MRDAPSACVRILVTNDDGIFSPGLRALAETASKLGEVRIVAQTTGLASEALRQGVVRILRRSLSRSPGSRAAAGALAGAALGYGAALLLGRFARETFADRRSLAWPPRRP